MAMPCFRISSSAVWVACIAVWFCSNSIWRCCWSNWAPVVIFATRSLAALLMFAKAMSLAFFWLSIWLWVLYFAMSSSTFCCNSTILMSKSCSCFWASIWALSWNSCNLRCVSAVCVFINTWAVGSDSAICWRCACWACCTFCTNCWMTGWIGWNSTLPSIDTIWQAIARACSLVLSKGRSSLSLKMSLPSAAWLT